MRSMADEGDGAATVHDRKALIRPALPGTFSRKGREKDRAQQSSSHRREIRRQAGGLRNDRHDLDHHRGEAAGRREAQPVQVFATDL